MASETLSLEQFSDRMKEAAGRLAGVSFQRPLKVCRQLIVSDVKQNFAGGHTPEGQPWKPLAHPRPRGGDKPLRDRGILMASIVSTGQGHIEQLTDTSLTVGTNLNYARLHQEGGVITPKNAKALAIPLTRDAARAGSAKHFPRPLFVLRSKSGKGFLAESKGKGKRARTILHYVLVKRVVVPARRFLGFGDKLTEKIVTVFRDFLRRQTGGE